MGFPFEDAKPEPVTGAAGATTSSEFNKVESYEQLSTALSVDARAEARFGLFGADASLSLDKSMQLNSYSIFLYALAKVELAFQQVTSLTYKPDVLELLKQPGGTAAFRQAYGDWFIRGIATGGQFLSIIEIHTKNQDEKEQLDTELSGSYGYAVSGDLDLEKKFESSTGSTFSRVVRRQVGGTPVTINAPDDVVPAVTSWVSELTSGTKAVPYQVGWVSYDTVPVPGVNWLDASIAEENLDILGQARKVYTSALSDVMYVLENRDEFLWDGPVDDKGTVLGQEAWLKELQTGQEKLLQNRDDTVKKAKDIAKDLSTPLTGWSLIPVGDLKLPPRKKSSEIATTPTEPPKPLEAIGTIVLDPALVATFDSVTGFSGSVRDHRQP